jgi:hypothetical protein
MSFDVTSGEAVTTQTVETMAEETEKPRVHVGALLKITAKRLLTRPNGMAVEGPVLRLPIGETVMVIELLCEQGRECCPCGVKLLTSSGVTFALTDQLDEATHG